MSIYISKLQCRFISLAVYFQSPLKKTSTSAIEILGKYNQIVLHYEPRDRKNECIGLKILRFLNQSLITFETSKHYSHRMYTGGQAGFGKM